MKTNVYINSYNGDGSASVLFFKNVESVEALLDPSFKYHDDFQGNDSVSYRTPLM